MVDTRMQRKLRAIFSADVKGYSKLMGDDDEHTINTISAYRKIMAERIAAHQGRVVDAPGDNVLAEFSGALNAVVCAVEIQKELENQNSSLPEDRRMDFRIGINLGDIVHRKDRIYGDGVNVAARIESLADPGGICISRGIFDQVKHKVQQGFEYLGEHSVKNVAEPIRIYRLLLASEFEGRIIGEPATKSSIKKPATIAIGLILFLSLAILLMFYPRPPTIDPASLGKMAFPLPEKPSIAVLPFDNMSDDPKQEYLSDGISEEIISSLSKTDQLFVIARNSSFTYKGKPVKVKQVAEELGVRYVLEGSIRKSEERVRITAQLIDALSGHHLWAERYDRELTEIFTLQDDITKEIVTALRIKLTQGEQARIWGQKSDNLDLLLKRMEAVSLWNKGTREAMVEFGRIANEYIDTAPEDAYGYRTLAWYHWFFAMYGDSPLEHGRKAYEAAQKALSIDESDANSHSLLGGIYLMMRQHEKAIAEGKIAISLNPNGAFDYGILGLTMSYAGKVKEGIYHLKKAIRLDPFPENYHYLNLGRCYLLNGQYEESLEQYKKALHLAPDNMLSQIGITAVYSLMGRDEEARREAKKILEINPGWTVEDVTKAPFKNQDDAQLFMDALRKAGLPEKQLIGRQDKAFIKNRSNSTERFSNTGVIDLSGEWDAIYDSKFLGVSNDIIKITQNGDDFIGIKLMGSKWVPKGSETIKGKLEKNRIKSIYLKTGQGWGPAKGQLNKEGDEIALEQHLDAFGITIDVTLTRK
ncbi:MAG: adenylate/guanylate cyclase domain-containing protein [Desulfosarcinaceae bacterium]|nr:adenylate/guanylate cyclase domain-containing protein [Desulfosarcinaceae bacterium]